MTDYKQILAYQPILTPKIISIIEALQDNSLSDEQFHNRKSYAKRRGNLISVLEYSIAKEIVNCLEKENNVW